MAVARGLDGVKGYLETQMSSAKLRAERFEEQRREAGPVPLFVTISREAGAGGYVVADRLADLLTERRIGASRTPWTVFDREILAHVVENHDLPEDFMRDVERTRIPTIQAIVEEIFGVPFTAHSLVHMTSRAILHIASLGNAVIIGRAGNLVTRKLPRGLHVRLIASPERRVFNLMMLRHLDREAAEAHEVKENESRRDYVRRYFHRDIEDPHSYDLVVKTDDVGFDGAARLLANTLVIRTENLAKAEPTGKARQTANGR